MNSNLPKYLSEESDIFPLSDNILSDRLQFVTEIGAGNWGSVWLCRPKCDPRSQSVHEPPKVYDMKVAVKVVHRIPDPTTGARIQSLWNEMKIVRSFKNDPHPSIILFHSFILTPSYALITMAYLPTLVPVEVDEHHAKPWFHSLLSAVEFLHRRGVVHNDIKPANILLTEQRVPVFVDFGFAEKYNLESSKAFQSNLMYGTPDYLSPERARGIPHDTRKSDLWSLGVTFFEILIGRTPFEHVEGEGSRTEEEVELYWGRTLRGEWVGTWTMSKGMEKLLRRMLEPSADIRCDAIDAMADTYWVGRIETAAVEHKRSVSASHVSSPSVFLDKEIPGLMNTGLPWSTRAIPKNKEKEKENAPQQAKPKSILFSPVHHSRSHSQPKLALVSKPPVQPKKRHAVPPLANLPPIKGSPPTTPRSRRVVGRDRDNKENLNTSINVVSLPSNNNAPAARRPFGGARQPHSAVSQKLPPAPVDARVTVKDKGRDAANKRGGGVLRDLTGLNNRAVGRAVMIVKEKPKPIPLSLLKGKETDADVIGKKQDSVRKRVNEWERERERLKEMERLEMFGKARDEELERAKKDEEQGDILSLVTTSSLASTTDKEEIHFAKVGVRASAQIVPVAAQSFLDFSTPESDIVPSSANESSISAFKHSLKLSIDKGVRIVKSSTLGQVTGRTATIPSAEGIEEPDGNNDFSHLQWWEDDAIVRDAKSSPSGVRQTMRNERDAEDTRMDRMALWMRNVDKVVEDARQKFDSAAAPVPQPPLPLPLVSRSSSQSQTTRSSRFPRKVLAAGEIFSDQSTSSSSAPINADPPSVDKNLPALPTDDAHHATSSLILTPHRPRRATVTSRSPEPLKKQVSFDVDTGSPSKRKEKSKSQGNLLRPIKTIDRLELELQKEAMPPTSPRLSAVIDKSLFVKPPISHIEDESIANEESTFLRSRSLDFDRLTSSLVHAKPSPRKSHGPPAAVIDTPNRRRMEGVYDRLLMATTGVKKVGRGYQSDNRGPLPPAQYQSHHNSHRLFNSARPIPPPLSNEDLKHARLVDEFGLVTPKANPDVSHYKDDSSNTVAFVRRAFKAVAGKTATKRMSRTVVT